MREGRSSPSKKRQREEAKQNWVRKPDCHHKFYYMLGKGGVMEGDSAECILQPTISGLKFQTHTASSHYSNSGVYMKVFDSD